MAKLLLNVDCNTKEDDFNNSITRDNKAKIIKLLFRDWYFINGELVKASNLYISLKYKKLDLASLVQAILKISYSIVYKVDDKDWVDKDLNNTLITKTSNNPLRGY
jgi:hypothetical protein